jgi:hypothetical protein
MARGIQGQAIYVHPKAEMAIARFASHPKAGNVNLDLPIRSSRPPKPTSSAS